MTNGRTDNQLGKIHNSGLSDLVDARGISDEIGIRKPDPQTFRIVAQPCGSDPTTAAG